MPFIKTTAHKKFLSQCQIFISDNLEKDQVLTDDKAEGLKTDLVKLEQLAQAYLQTFSQLPELSREYDILQRRIRVKMRRLRMSKRKHSK